MKYFDIGCGLTFALYLSPVVDVLNFALMDKSIVRHICIYNTQGQLMGNFLNIKK
ncbi:MAG: hypothetical protein IT223_01955 [Crocinitomicaceae bacterium]|nr:hypothetical protein [Crocinitomicaceae bacterium]